MVLANLKYKIITRGFDGITTIDENDSLAAIQYIFSKHVADWDVHSATLFDREGNIGAFHMKGCHRDFAEEFRKGMKNA